MLTAPLLLACLLAPQEGVPPRENADEPLTGIALERQAEAELEAALDAPLAKPLVFAPGATVASVVVELLPEQTVMPDSPRLDLEGIDLRDLPLYGGVELPAGRFSVRRAIEELLDSVNEVPLTMINDGGILKITTQDYADERLVTRVYPVRDLLEAAGPGYVDRPQFQWHGGSMGGGGAAPQGGLGGGGFGGGGQFSLAPVANQFGAAQPQPQAAPAPAKDGPPTPLEIAQAAEQPLIDLIQTVTGGIDNGGGWEEIDGEGGAMEYFDGVLSVRQTEAVHRQIATLLSDLRDAFDDQPWSFPIDVNAAHAADHAAHDHSHDDHDHDHAEAVE
ncbi:hypothetical protein [Alienimonas chondri]|uniref:Uncharacterized protein n=1 Tax=Alienimonas chondri TaxID=2681879 RepID=A0ABX1VL19_9PLAN|nr:hypothetical protein [Alienimonas chondri]NNJ28011.1 hypothetical protein [Alienimonas chondri]